jgi:hypothetical protein
MRRLLAVLVAGLVIGITVLGGAFASGGPTVWVEGFSPRNADDRKAATVDCPAGYVLSGGGAAIHHPGGGDDVALSLSKPNNAGDGWRAVAKEIDPRSEDWRVDAYAVCEEEDQ